MRAPSPSATARSARRRVAAAVLTPRWTARNAVRMNRPVTAAADRSSVHPPLCAAHEPLLYKDTRRAPALDCSRRSRRRGASHSKEMEGLSSRISGASSDSATPVVDQGLARRDAMQPASPRTRGAGPLYQKPNNQRPFLTILRISGTYVENITTQRRGIASCLWPDAASGTRGSVSRVPRPPREAVRTERPPTQG